MIREICKDEFFLSQKSEPATADDLAIAQDLLDTLAAHKDGCVGMAANMIGVNKRIIAFDNNGDYVVMFNPVIVKKSAPYDAEEGCLSLIGTRKTKRYQTIKAAKSIGEWTDVFPRQFAAARLDPVVVRETETEVPHEQTLRGGDALLLQKRGNVALTDRDGTAQPPFAQTVCALTAAERQQLWTRTGCDLEDSAGQIVELQGRNDIVFVHQIIFLLCHTHHLPAFSASSIP